MERANRLVVVAAAVTALVLLAQLALINAMSGAYLTRPGSSPLAEELENLMLRKAAVFEELPTLPVLLMHGMGDAAGNPGMKRIQSVSAWWWGYLEREGGLTVAL